MCQSRGMRTAVLTLTLGLLASACSSSAPSGVSLSGESLSETADEFAEWLAGAGALLNEDAGFEVMTEEGFICAANRLVDEFGPSDVSDTFSRIAGPEIHTSVMVAYVDAVYVCGDIRRWVASEAVGEIGAALDVEFDSDFFDCLVEGLSEEEARDFFKKELSTRDSEKIIDDSIMKWVDLGIHTRADFCAPEFAPVLEAHLVGRIALELIDFDRARGVDFLNEDEYRCAVRRVVYELGVNVVSDVHSGVADAADREEFGFVFADAATDCVDQEKWADEIAEWFAAKGLSALERLGALEPNVAEGLTPDDISCAARRFVDEVGPKVLNDVFVGAEDFMLFDELGDELADELSAALFDCWNLQPVFPSPPTTTTTPSDPPEEDWDEIEENIRARVVELLIERGMTPEEAEIEADERMAEGTEVEVVEDQFAIWEDWMDNYPSHPVLGNHWTADEAECVIIAMMRKRGIYETDRQIKGATEGGMNDENAEFLVRPVADCVDLRAMALADMLQSGVEDPECLLADVAEDQIAAWYVAQFTDGRDGFRELYLQDINQSC